jgi:hypothetical protein
VFVGALTAKEKDSNLFSQLIKQLARFASVHSAVFAVLHEPLPVKADFFVEQLTLSWTIVAHAK